MNLVDVMFLVAEVAVVCAGLLVVLGAISLLKGFINWYDDRQYKKQAEFILECYLQQASRKSASLLYEDFKVNHKGTYGNQN